MTELNDEQNQVEILSKFPWPKIALILVSGIGFLFTYITYQAKNKAEDDKGRETERVSYLRVQLIVKDQTIAKLSAEKDSCNKGNTAFITDVFNREIALKLSKDTTTTAKKIVESLLRSSEYKQKK